MTALELASAIKTKKLSVQEAVGSYIEKIEKDNKLVNAFLAVAKENALLRAQEIQSRINSGETLSPLAGVPIALKDNISTAGLETTCASKMLSGYKPVFNAAVVEKLENAGLIVIGKLNMDEFAMGGTSETGVFGAVRNPWSDSHVAGGSSGGSAAAIASGLAPIALGTDTGGSIGKPCSFCGVTGLKPTYGSVSRFGIIACASSLDQAGPIGQNIEDCAALLSIISGPDERDSTCTIEKPFDFNASINGANSADIKNLKIGLPGNYLDGKTTGLNEEVKAAVLAAVKEFESAGVKVEEFEMPLMEYMIPAYLIISTAEISSNLARYDGLKYGYRSTNAKNLNEIYNLSRSESLGAEVKRKIMLGSFMLSSENYDIYYKKALQVRSLIKETYNKLFKQYDIILSPVTPTTASKIGASLDDPAKMYSGGIFNVSVNLAGLPTATLPCGFDNGLPIGFQLIGDAFTENKLIDAARVYQDRTDFHSKRPNGAAT